MRIRFEPEQKKFQLQPIVDIGATWPYTRSKRGPATALRPNIGSDPFSLQAGAEAYGRGERPARALGT